MGRKIMCLPHQGKFLQVPYVFEDIRFFFEICGYAAGKTSSLVYSVFMCVKYVSGYRDNEGKKPKIVVAGITLTFLKKTFSGALINLLDLTGTEYSWNKADNIIDVAGVQIFLIPIAEEGDIFGYDVYAVFVDELDELPTDTSMAVVKSLNDRTRQLIPDRRPPFLAFATTSQGLKGTYQTVQEFILKDISFIIIRGSTKDNIYLPPEYIDAMYKIYDKKQTACLLDGQFVAVDCGLVLPQYDHSKNYLTGIDLWDKLPSGQVVFLCQDFNQGSGFNKALAITVFEDTMYIVKEYEFPDWTTAPKTFRYDFPQQELYWIPDMTYKENFPMAQQALRAYNIKLILKSANPLVSDRNVAINAAFRTQRLMVCDCCVESDKAFMMWQNDKKTGKPMKGKTSKAPDHLGDCLGYGVYHIVGNMKEFKDLFDVTLGRMARKRDESGYLEVIAGALALRKLVTNKIKRG